eukprot:8344581-Lingulodinium_polyedra.AAC.1
MKRSFFDIIERNENAPLLTSKSCDGTPINVVEHARVRLSSGKQIRASGRSSHEFLIKLQWVRALHPDGTHDTGVLLDEAQSLRHGKKAAAIVTACKQHWRTLRSCGHTGLAVEHYAWDRCGATALERFFRQVHKEEQ